ncbi:hypothetical protein PLESTB_000688100 [Pleodorina starrii]|uniref:Uncharacterized protein n=1 Tax=Pleodorina starrii TaxID=330485 RepID=A0A9W6F1L6_9CHLO|nr:hypothetical protein PLESTB_000688100 [Pleodorina starrii]GLC65214.1 hypothetical protein PLESTF_000264300 [Pleodorina starrii]
MPLFCRMLNPHGLMSAAHCLRSSAGPPSCSNRVAGQARNFIRLTSLRQARIARQRVQVVVVDALYNFADAAEVRTPGQRRNRGLLKKEAREIMDVVRGLTSMTPKQLAAVSHLLPPGTVEAVGIAAKLPRSNQGRKRQEGLVAKMLRGQLTEQQMEKLEDAVKVATEHQGIFDDGDVSGLVEVWREGLLQGEEAVVAEVYGYPLAWAPDHQQLRLLVRQCQQALEEEREQEAARMLAEPSSSSSEVLEAGRGVRGGGDSSSESGGDEEEEEDLAAVLALAAARSGGGGGGGGRGRRRLRAPEPRSRGLLRSLGKLLRPLALRVVQEGAAGGV